MFKKINVHIAGVLGFFGALLAATSARADLALPDNATHNNLTPDKGPAGFVKLYLDYAPYLLAFFVTLLIEVPVFFLFGFRTRKAMWLVALANLISVPLFQIAKYYSPTTLWGLDTVFVLEVLVVIFESAFLIIFLKGMSYKRIILATVVANIASGLVGSWAVFYYFLQLR